MFVDFLTMVWRKLRRSGMTMNQLLMSLLMELTDSETIVAILQVAPTALWPFSNPSVKTTLALIAIS